MLASSPGVLGAPVVSAVPVAGQWLFAFDVNDDGNLDLVAVGNGSAVALLGDGTGAFVAGTPVALSTGGGAAIADFDGDGNIDVAGWGNGSVDVAFGDGTGDCGGVATTG